MPRATLGHFPDGTYWNTSGQSRIWWTEITPDMPEYRNGHVREFSVINLAIEVDMRWPEILDLARRGHMDTTVFEGKVGYISGLMQVTFTKNLYCATKRPNVRFHQTHDKVLYWASVLPLGEHTATEKALCAFCYDYHASRGEVMHAEVLP